MTRPRIRHQLRRPASSGKAPEFPESSGQNFRNPQPPASTFPIVDPIYARYLKLRPLTPASYRFVAPPISGEAGWILDGGVVNHDVAVVQERIQFLHFSGVLDWVIEAQAAERRSVLEIGAGGGLFALAFNRCVPGCTYYICDVPETLAVACASSPCRRRNTLPFLQTGLCDCPTTQGSRLGPSTSRMRETGSSMSQTT
jgi:hypothetical protein